jgi:hypothetical protein
MLRKILSLPDVLMQSTVRPAPSNLCVPRRL